jgi:hypothetical protein
MNDIETLSNGGLQLAVSITIRQLIKDDFACGATELYVFRNGEDIFYIGVSTDAASRALRHVGRGEGFMGNDGVERFINDNKPASYGWTVELYQLKPCGKYETRCSLLSIDDRNIHGIARTSQCRQCLEWHETTLIRELHPSFNTARRNGGKPFVGQYVDWREIPISVDMGLE